MILKIKIKTQVNNCWLQKHIINYNLVKDYNNEKE